MPFEARKLVLPDAQLGDDLDDLGRKEVDDMPGTDLRGSEVEAEIPAVGKVAVTIAAGLGNRGGAQAAKGVEALDGRLLAAEQKEG